MSSPRFDLEIEQGEDYSIVFTYKIDGVAVDLTSYTAALKAKVNYDDTAAVISLANGSGLTLGGVAGTITVAIAGTSTAGYSFDEAFYDLKITSGSSVSSYVAWGMVTLKKRASKS